jgi:hypothetical protein
VPNTALPGQPGTLVLVGHRSIFGTPFGRVGELVAGDSIILAGRGGTRTYRVGGAPKRVARLSALTAAPGHLLLLTGDPKFGASRLIVVDAAPSDEVRGTSGLAVPVRALAGVHLLRPSGAVEVLSLLCVILLVAIRLGGAAMVRRTRRRPVAVAVVFSGAAVMVVLLGALWVGFAAVA